MVSPRPLVSDFDPLSPVLHLYTPRADTAPVDTHSDPRLIILATWMNAPPKLIRLYAGWYRARFPGSRILLLMTDMGHLFWMSKQRHDALLQPALSVLAEAAAEGDKGRIVSAVYSNGGAFGLTALARLYQCTNGTPLPVSALVLDSAPGSGGDVPSGRRAVLASLPPALRSWPTRYLTLGLVYALFAGYWLLLRLILRKIDPITQLRADLLDPKLLPDQGRRTYVFSKEDEMVGQPAVLSHADASGKAGWDVRVEEWKGSKHVAHAAKDPERYWRVVKDTFGAGGADGREGVSMP